LINPLYGLFISISIKIAADTDSAQTNSTPITVLLFGASKPKLTKITLSQKTRTNSKIPEICLFFCSNSIMRECVSCLTS